jgi:hypothetical protein
LVEIKGMTINLQDKQLTNLWIIENIDNGEVHVINLDTNQCSKSTLVDYLVSTDLGILRVASKISSYHDQEKSSILILSFQDLE